MKLHYFVFLTTMVVAIASAEKYTGPTNQAGVNLIKEFEGFVPNFYTDPVGIKTIGYGHGCHVFNCRVPLNGLYRPPLTKSQGEALLKSDLKSGYESCVKNAVTYGNLNANQYSALVSFVFNLGCGSLKSSTLLKKLNTGDTLGASKEFGKWVNAGGRPLPGLVRRREAERKLFCSSGGCGTAGSSCVGSVTANPSLKIRKSPNLMAAVVGSVNKGASVTISSRVTGTAIFGNKFWFKIPQGYVSAYYIKITQGSQAWCKTS